ncbi:iron ABC transporter permease [Bacteroidales bacterium OttesenSCG-928-L19]|nr:iron ABC transporter permease [Bacteroidales bacterium OttesenSCG-928-L19]
MAGKRKIWISSLIILAVIAGALIAASIGVVSVSLGDIFKIIAHKIGFIEEIDIPRNIVTAFWELRLPRVVMSLLAGASLAICGALFQSIFRNPICDPYILGISSGASLGAAVAFILGWDILLLGITLPALVTALLTLFLIIGIAQIGKNRNTEKLLLTGIAINFMISAVITLLIVINQKEMSKIIFWTMGSFATVNWNDIYLLIPVMLITIFPLFYYSKELNIMQMGSDTAKTLGVNTTRVTGITLIFSSILIATVVSMCGVIGFIGLIIPHIVRLIFGNNNRQLFFYSLFFGAFFMLIADTFARTLAIPSELPVGSITAIAGAPYFIYLLLRK